MLRSSRSLSPSPKLPLRSAPPRPRPPSTRRPGGLFGGGEQGADWQRSGPMGSCSGSRGRRGGSGGSRTLSGHWARRVSVCGGAGGGARARSKLDAQGCNLHPPVSASRAHALHGFEARRKDAEPRLPDSQGLLPRLFPSVQETGYRGGKLKKCDPRVKPSVTPSPPISRSLFRPLPNNS